MQYFKNFPAVPYAFGDETLPDIFRNISIYATVIDDIRNNIAFYQDYYIQEFERPDQVSYKLYGTPNFHWTFYFMNDKIRERGWPLSNRSIIAKSLKLYSSKTLTTRTLLVDRFSVGQTISGTVSGATGKIDHRHLDLGQLVLTNTSGTFTVGETVQSTNTNGEVEDIVVTSYEDEYNSAHHYENASGEYADIDPTVGPGALLTEVTYLDRLTKENDELKQIRVLKPSSVVDVTNAFKEAIRN